MNDKFQNRYRIPSARAAWHDYNGGSYFITICVKKHRHVFGKIVSGTASTDPVMQFTPLGQCADNYLRDISSHYLYAEIPLWVVMPNHIHAIVFIDGGIAAARNVSTGKNEQMQKIANHRGRLSVVLGGFKSAVTKFANENEISFAWQAGFDDRIIRTQNSMNGIADYIENNVARWDRDYYNELSGKTPPSSP